ncbi:MAG: amidoligase enzyme [Cyanobium sp. NAT70]|nr:amidoligase enzyme [Cyanobium sp. NAT70]|tara:strand:- start:36 stop:1112 length:1077 start_codon:yes stop_codon:yes gene_type:complete
MQLSWKIGFEIEYLAPRNYSRKDLACAIASFYGGHITRIFHQQVEPSLVPDQPVFDNLTLGFKVNDREDQLIALCVDDLTLQNDLQKSCLPKQGWYRIVSDDTRILQLIRCHCDPNLPIDQVLIRLAELFHTTLQADGSGMHRVIDASGKSVAIVAPLPGERERPCELVTAPIAEHHRERLGCLLDLVNQLQFQIPAEAATHLHFDATCFYSPDLFKNLVLVYRKYHVLLEHMFPPNRRCRRLGAWPNQLFDLISHSSFETLGWPDARQLLAELPLTKYCNYNLINIINQDPIKPTFEIRNLPAMLDCESILSAAIVHEALLTFACQLPQCFDPTPVPATNQTIDEFLTLLGVPRDVL